jgi:hypothetical protein
MESRTGVINFSVKRMCNTIHTYTSHTCGRKIDYLEFWRYIENPLSLDR